MSTAALGSGASLSLNEYAHLVLSFSMNERVRLGHPQREWLLIDQGDTVLETFPEVGRAFARLNALFDDDPLFQEQRRLVVLDAGVVAFTAWPRNDSPAE